MFICNLFQSVFYFNKYKLTGFVKTDSDLIYFKINLLLIIFIMCCWVAAVTLLIYL